MKDFGPLLMLHQVDNPGTFLLATPIHISKFSPWSDGVS